MKIKPRDAEAFIRSPDRNHLVFLIFGPDTGAVRERAEGLSKSLVPDLDDPFAVTRMTDEDIKADPASLADALSAFSLTGGDRLVRVRLSGDMAALARTIAEIDSGDQPCEAWLVIEAGDLKKASKLRKTVEDMGRGAALACYSDDGRDLAAIADAQLAEEGLRLNPEARAMLIPYLEGDRALARGELEKLVLYKGLKSQRREGDDDISREDIQAISTAGSDAALDQIIEPALTGDPTRTDRSYHQSLAGGMSAVGILRALQRRLDQIGTFHSGGGDTGALARAGAPRFGPPADAFRKSARAFSGRRLDHARKLAFDAERSVKRSGAVVEPIVGELLLRLARASQSR